MKNDIEKSTGDETETRLLGIRVSNGKGGPFPEVPNYGSLGSILRKLSLPLLRAV